MKLDGPPTHNPNKLENDSFYTDLAEKARKIFSMNNNTQKEVFGNKNLISLEEASMEIVTKLSEAFSKISLMDSESDLKKQPILINGETHNVKYEITTLGNFLSINIFLPNEKKPIEYGYFILFGYKNNNGTIETTIKYLNSHREVPAEIRGLGLGRRTESFIEKSASNAKITQLHYKSGPLNNSILFALTQGYKCVNEADKETVSRLVDYLMSHPNEINDKKPPEMLKYIEFQKTIQHN